MFVTATGGGGGGVKHGYFGQSDYWGYMGGNGGEYCVKHPLPVAPADELDIVIGYGGDGTAYPENHGGLTSITVGSYVVRCEGSRNAMMPNDQLYSRGGGFGAGIWSGNPAVVPHPMPYRECQTFYGGSSGGGWSQGTPGYYSGAPAASNSGGQQGYTPPYPEAYYYITGGAGGAASYFGDGGVGGCGTQGNPGSFGYMPPENAYGAGGGGGASWNYNDGPAGDGGDGRPGAVMIQWCAPN